jgi:hypothetical protein
VRALLSSVIESAERRDPNAPLDWDGWYRNASPGPYFACHTQSGTAPVFDNDQGSPVSPDPSKRNASVPGSFNLTPGTSYSCQTAGGELSWNASTRVLTMRGTTFIDGNAQVQNGALNTYQSQGSLYLSGTLLVKNSKLCAHVAAGSCDSTGWDPNTTMLVVVANGPGGIQVPAGDSVQLVSSTFQGALYGTNAVEIDTTSQAIGPIIGSTVYLGHRRPRGCRAARWSTRSPTRRSSMAARGGPRHVRSDGDSEAKAARDSQGRPRRPYP